MTARRAIAAFQAAFGARPRLGATAPGRINLIGEHTDYNDGFVLPLAIDRACIIVGSPAADPARTRIVSADLGGSAAFDARRPLSASSDAADSIIRGSWPSYIAGIFEHLRRAGAAPPNLDLAIASDIPIGAGLSSSAALEVAAATLLESALGLALDPLAKARLCRDAEHEFAGVPCGMMDQLASIMGRDGHTMLIDCRDHRITHVPLPPSLAILAIDSGVRHRLASGEYANRRATCEAAARALSIPALRDADLATLDRGARLLTEEQRRCARHVIAEIARTRQAAGLLSAGGDPRILGDLLLRSHASLRDDYAVSCRELDAIVDIAAPIPGVHGARMTGAGFGGCAVAIADPDALAPLAAALAAEYPRLTGRACTLMSVRAVSGARAFVP